MITMNDWLETTLRSEMQQGQQQRSARELMRDHRIQFLRASRIFAAPFFFVSALVVERLTPVGDGTGPGLPFVYSLSYIAAL